MTRSTPSPVRNVALLTALALVPVGLLAASGIILASRQVTSVVNKQVETTATVSSVVIGQQTSDLVSLVHSYATRPSLINGLGRGRRGGAQVDANLAGLAHSVPGISATFITSPLAVSRYVYPSEPSVIGTSFAYRDWYTGLVASGRPYVSNAIVTQEASHALAVTITDYVRDAKGRPIAILGVNYSLQTIKSFTANVAAAQGITLTVTDRVGTSLTTTGAHGLVSFAADPRVRAARAGHTGLMRYAPLRPDGSHEPKQLSAYAPVASTGWTVIASVPEHVAFAGLKRLRDTVLAITALLVLILLAGARLIERSERRRRSSERDVRAGTEELARMLDSTDEGFVSIDGHGAVTAWNARAEALFGRPSVEVMGLDLADTLIPAASRASFRMDLTSFRDDPNSTFVGRRVEMSALHRDGREIPVEMGLWAHDDEDGFSAFMHDITERVAIAADRESARDEALQATRMKSEFLAEHEPRDPHADERGDRHERAAARHRARRRAAGVRRDRAPSAEALLTVINDILDFSKIEAGQLDARDRRLRPARRWSRSPPTCSRPERAAGKGLELACRIDPDVPRAADRATPGGCARC